MHSATRAVRWVVVGVAGVLAIGACTATPSSPGGAAAPDETSTNAPTWERVTDPSLGLATPSAYVYGATGIDDEIVLVGAGSPADDQATTPKVWTSADGGSFHQLDDPALGQTGAVVLGVAAGEDHLTAVGVDISDGTHARAWTRDTDGAWSTAQPEVPDVTGTTLSAVAALDDGSFVAAGLATRDGKQSLIVARRSPDGSWSGQCVENTDAVQPTAIATDGEDTVVITGYRRIAAGLDPTGWVSTDGGSTWTEIVAGAFGPVGAGRPITIAWVDNRFVALGTNSDETAMAGWVSEDGTTWEELDVTADGEPIALRPGPATVFEGGLLVPATPLSGGPFPSAVFLDPEQGFEVQEYPDVPGVAYAPMGAGPVATTTDQIVLTVPVPRSVMVIRETPDNEDFVKPGEGAFPESDPLQRVAAVAADGDRLLIGGSEGPKGRADHISSDPLLWIGTPGSLRTDTVDATNVSVVAALPDGGFVAAGSISGSGQATGCAIASADEPTAGEADCRPTTDVNDLWIGTVDQDGSVQQTGTVAEPGEQRAQTLVHIGDRWYLGGSVRPHAQEPGMDAGIWSSTDLVTWTTETGAFEEASIVGICAAGDQLVAVGSVRDTSRVNHPMVWTRGADGTWSRSDTAEHLPTERGSFTSCASGDDAVTVIGSSDDVPVVLRTTDGTSLTSTGFDGVENVTAVSIAGSAEGLVIVGVDQRDLLPRPVLWTSADGSSWQEIVGPVPQSGNPSGATGLAFGVDGTLFVIGQDGDAPALWQVTDPFAG